MGRARIERAGRRRSVAKSFFAKRVAPAPAASPTRADRQQLEFLAAITTEYEGKLRDVLREEADAEAQAARERELLELLAAISTRHEQELHDLPWAEAEARRESELMEFVRDQHADI